MNEIYKSGVKSVYVHARNAILSGISPKPIERYQPHNYDFVIIKE